MEIVMLKTSRFTKTILLFFILFNVSFFPQTELNGFWNLKWGDSLKKVKSFMKNKATFTREFNSEDYYYLEYTSGMFVNLPVEFWIFKFTDNKLYNASVGFNIPNIEVYDKLVVDITNKYGNPIRNELYISEWFISYTLKDEIKFSRIHCNAGNGLGFEEGSPMIWLNYSDDEMRIEESNKVKNRRKDEL